MDKPPCWTAPFSQESSTESIFMSPMTTPRACWGRLPEEIRHIILNILLRDGVSCAGFAAVSREWQEVIEQHNFGRITLTPSCLADFNTMTYRNRHRVNYLWLCLELKRYDQYSFFGIRKVDNDLIVNSIQSLFSILSKWDWEPNGKLVLDIGVHSPSDTEGRFANQTILPDLPPEACSYDELALPRAAVRAPKRWEIGPLFDELLYNPPDHIRKLEKKYTKIERKLRPAPDFDVEALSPDEFLDYLDDRWALEEKLGDQLDRVDRLIDAKERQWDERRAKSDEAEIPLLQPLPLVPVVTGVLLRQQTRRRWPEHELTHLFSRLPRLEEIYFEPWREWSTSETNNWDIHHQNLVEDLGLSASFKLKKLVLFENFSLRFASLMKGDLIRTPSLKISEELAYLSHGLESLSASFLTDAYYFFKACDPLETWWHTLTSLTLTSQLMWPGASRNNVTELLEAAAGAAMRMPKLKTMEIWNGRKGLAVLFKYQSQPPMLTWRGTFRFTMPSSVIEAWEKVSQRYHGCGCAVIEEHLLRDLIKSHGDAIHHLKHSQPVLRPVSLYQIRTEESHLDD
ncbi:hypothetical protein G7046_g9263 [Stylonectria norvegica]|nr:hypothetical protein G7046_g9263 [Stylonectria norvegica]